MTLKGIIETKDVYFRYERQLVLKNKYNYKSR